MGRFGVYIFVWVGIIIVFRTFIQISVLTKYKSLINELSIDRLFLFIPEITPLKELKQSQDINILKIYTVIRSYKFIFWLGFVITFIILMLP